MIGEKMQEALNRQVNAELYSAYLYLSMATYLESEDLKGFAHWMVAQAKEETSHAMRLAEHVADRGGRVKLTAIDAPPADWDSPLAVFQDTCAHEAKVTALIHELVDLAGAEGDHAAAAMLQWFVNEQVEEEATPNEIRAKLERLKGAPNGVFMLDRALGERA
jgi:ferritin